MEESLTIKVAHRPFRVKLCTFMKIAPGMVRIGISLTVLGKIPSMMYRNNKSLTYNLNDPWFEISLI